MQFSKKKKHIRQFFAAFDRCQTLAIHQISINDITWSRKLNTFDCKIHWNERRNANTTWFFCETEREWVITLHKCPLGNTICSKKLSLFTYRLPLLFHIFFPVKCNTHYTYYASNAVCPLQALLLYICVIALSFIVYMPIRSNIARLKWKFSALFSHFSLFSHLSTGLSSYFFPFL